MTDKQLNNLIEIITEKLPEGTNLNTFLADTLTLGRESVYRRLRGQIHFTFDEIATLSLKLGFSIDNFIGVKKGETALFNIHMLQDTNYFDTYTNKMTEYGKMFREMSKHSNTNAHLAINTLPYYFHIKYKDFSRFRIYKWLYQTQKVDLNSKFSEFVLPEKILETHRTFYQDIQRVPNVTIIMDGNIFWSAAKDIEYFLNRGLISFDEMLALKAELLDMINMLEQIAIEGANRNGSEIHLYVCSVDIEASYLHFEYGDNQFSQVRIYAISATDSHSERLCEIQKKWIESLKRYSVLISGSGEVQRIKYMNRQREIIDSLPEVK